MSPTDGVLIWHTHEAEDLGLRSLHPQKHHLKMGIFYRVPEPESWLLRGISALRCGDSPSDV